MSSVSLPPARLSPGRPARPHYFRVLWMFLRNSLIREMAFRDQIAHDDVDALVEQVRRSEDAQEGMAARLARRKPAFKGR